MQTKFMPVNGYPDNNQDTDHTTVMFQRTVVGMPQTTDMSKASSTNGNPERTTTSSTTMGKDEITTGNIMTTGTRKDKITTRTNVTTGTSSTVNMSTGSADNQLDGSTERMLLKFETFNGKGFQQSSDYIAEHLLCNDVL